MKKEVERRAIGDVMNRETEKGREMYGIASR